MPFRITSSVIVASLLACAVPPGPVSEMRERWGERLISEKYAERLTGRAGTSLPPTHRNRESFQALEAPITALEVFRSVGLPDADVGSGFRIFLYALSDGAYVKVWSPGFELPSTITLYEQDGTARKLLQPP